MALNTYSMDFESGSTQYASADDSASLSITGNLTLECWVRFESLPGAGTSMSMVSKYAASNISYEFNLYNGAGTYYLNGITSADGTATTDNSVTWSTPLVNTWYHVAMVVTVGSKTEYFVDGVQVGADQTAPAAIFNGNAALTIGGRLTTIPFDGLIDEVRIWAVAKTAAELAAAKDDHVAVDSANLNAYYRFNNNALDETANNNDLTLVNTPVYSATVPFVGTADATSTGFIFISS